MRNVDNLRSLPDVYYVRVHHHPREWTNGALPTQPTVYQFRVTGKASGGRWLVHSVYANLPVPPESRLRMMSALKSTITHALSELIGLEIARWDNSLLTWEDK